jgi:hypothetical protein
MCGFIRTVGANIRASNKGLNVIYGVYTAVIRRDGSCLVGFNENQIKTEKGAQELLYRCQKETGTHWCIIYTSHKFHVLPDPRDKRNNGIYHFKYEEDVTTVRQNGIDWSTYRLSHT